MSQFIDEVKIVVRSGDGGNGMVAWRREKYEPMGGPAGGSGGKGGDIYLQAVSDKSTLLDFRYKTEYLAENGQRGGPKNKHGRDGKDLIIEVPVGTIIKDLDSDKTIADLNAGNMRIVVAQGGRGGKGNAMLATPTRRAPHFCEPGSPGITRHLHLELKLLADIGIVGLPNAGKSTLLSVLTHAKPKIADYPFTTLTPQLGVVKLSDGGDFVLADIPGLIEGASKGVGLGHRFLKHIERTGSLVHLIDISSETIEKDIETIDKELANFDEKLGQLPQVMVLNKADLCQGEERAKKADLLGKVKPQSPVLVISAATGEGTRELVDLLSGWIKKARSETFAEGARKELQSELAPDEDALIGARSRDESFDIHRKKNVFTVQGDRPERLVSVTNMRDPESLHHLYRTLRSIGVIDALIENGIRPGNTVRIGGAEFVYGDEWG